MYSRQKRDVIKIQKRGSPFNNLDLICIIKDVLLTKFYREGFSPRSLFIKKLLIKKVLQTKYHFLSLREVIEWHFIINAIT